jgi:hypothetical protein
MTCNSQQNLPLYTGFIDGNNTAWETRYADVVAGWTPSARSSRNRRHGIEAFNPAPAPAPATADVANPTRGPPQSGCRR